MRDMKKVRITQEKLDEMLWPKLQPGETSNKVRFLGRRSRDGTGFIIEDIYVPQLESTPTTSDVTAETMARVKPLRAKAGFDPLVRYDGQVIADYELMTSTELRARMAEIGLTVYETITAREFRDTFAELGLPAAGFIMNDRYECAIVEIRKKK